MIIFQALLGMWTVTWLLKPIVVMGHLLGGLATFSLLVWMAWRATDQPIRAGRRRRSCGACVIVGLVLLALQIALGGWTSANYAALACGTRFPASAWASGGRRTISAKASCCGAASAWTTKAACSTAQSRIAIQLAHRMMAVVVFVLPAGGWRCSCCARRACAAGRRC